jgi:peptidoglycan/xylan/chitin deacetylase (PgdA/CDA1 family)
MSYLKKVPHGIMFHHFHNEKHPKSQGSISEDDFVKILDYVGYDKILSPEEWLERLAKNKLGPEDICLTFDDGLLSQMDVALPVLERLNLKAFWFVYSSVFEGGIENLEIYRSFRAKYFNVIDDFYESFFKKVAEAGAQTAVEGRIIKEQQKLYPFYSVNDVKFRFLRDKILGQKRYEKLMDFMLEEYQITKQDLSKDLWMSNKDLKYLSDSGHDVGLHSYSHPTALADLFLQEQLKEYQKNYFHLERVCGKEPAVMSHPCNSYNGDTLKVLNQLGIICGFRANMFPRQEVDGLNASNLEFAREDHANLMRNF